LGYVKSSLISGAEMLIPVSMIALSAQIVLTVADVVPKYDIARGCRLDSTQAFDLNAGLDETVPKDVLRMSGERWRNCKPNGLNSARPTKRSA
jgi:hypothetical protein